MIATHYIIMLQMFATMLLGMKHILVLYFAEFYDYPTIFHTIAR